MDDKEYFQFWHSAQKCKDNGFTTDYQMGETYDEFQIRIKNRQQFSRMVIKLFLNEFNRRHHSHMTVSEYLK
ncbi:MAG: hypothetical protein SOH70_03945 [Lentilactobacillus sunkii]|uniref:hypothetical protein n=1 Tax=Lentilactobacillus sunkii TaxID=481719 RepID=UPI002F352C10